jgi:ElaB/YqjD/DUF883 family membrane-anchored ribosome-binding protein
MATTTKIDKTDDEDMTAPLKKEIAALRAELGDLTTLVTETGRARAAKLRVAAESAAKGGLAKGEAKLEDVLKDLHDLEDEVLSATRERPVAALGLAALIGFLVGVLFRR